MTLFLNIFIAVGVGALAMAASGMAHYEQHAGRKSWPYHAAGWVLMFSAIALAVMA